jgi:hypothetical protein
MFSAQKTNKPTRHDRGGALYTTGPFNGRERGAYDGLALRHSYSTQLALQPAQSALGFALLGIALVGASRYLRGSPRRSRASSRGNGGGRAVSTRSVEPGYVDYDPRLPESPPRYPGAYGTRSGI